MYIVGPYFLCSTSHFLNIFDLCVYLTHSLPPERLCIRFRKLYYTNRLEVDTEIPMLAEPASELCASYLLQPALNWHNRRDQLRVSSNNVTHNIIATEMYQAL